MLPLGSSILLFLYITFMSKLSTFMLSPFKIGTTIQPADMGTKATSGPLLEQHYGYIRGLHFYPPKG